MEESEGLALPHIAGKEIMKVGEAIVSAVSISADSVDSRRAIQTSCRTEYSELVIDIAIRKRKLGITSYL